MIKVNAFVIGRSRVFGGRRAVVSHVEEGFGAAHELVDVSLAGDCELRGSE